jgi:hypothetical protein
MYYPNNAVGWGEDSVPFWELTNSERLLRQISSIAGANSTSNNVTIMGAQNNIMSEKK